MNMGMMLALRVGWCGSSFSWLRGFAGDDVADHDPECENKEHHSCAHRECGGNEVIARITDDRRVECYRRCERVHPRRERESRECERSKVRTCGACAELRSD